MVQLTSGILNVLGTVFTPLAATYGGYPAMFAVRLVAGIGQGFQRPSINAIVARWYPVDERSTIVSLYTTGMTWRWGAKGCSHACFLQATSCPA